MYKYIDWEGFQGNVEHYIKRYGGIGEKPLKSMFDNYSENRVNELPIASVDYRRELFMDLITHTIDMADTLTPDGILEKWMEDNK